MRTGTLADGARGFDANQPITAAAAAAFVAHGYQFAVRYVKRRQQHDYDLSHAERDVILGAGLGLMIVQHVAPDGWVPTPDDGAGYGAIAASECQALGLPGGFSVWCDLEGVHAETPSHDVITFCNNWFEAVNAAGYRPSLYVGWHAGLTPDELYHKLSFDAYWSAYNLDAGEFPAVRGVQMRQSAAKAADLIPGFTNQTLDVDVIHADALGGTPTLLFQES